MRKAIVAKGAVAPAGKYSHAIIANGFVYVSGQGPLDPATNRVPDDFAGQVRQVLRNLQTILKGAGVGLADVVKMNVYLADVARFREYNAIYNEFFSAEPPARTTVGAQLVGAQIEVDCIAALVSDRKGA